MKLISGLGNPTRRYRWTRHNVGFLAIDRVAKVLFIRLKRRFSYRSLIGEGKFKDEKIILLKPLTFMNLSGGAISTVVNDKKVDIENVMIVCDDVSLGLGRIRIRKSGGSGGHNGLGSIIENLKTEEFTRLRIGTGGQKATDKDLSEYVLEKFTRKELVLVDKVLDVVSDAVKTYMVDGVDAAMGRYNSMEIS